MQHGREQVGGAYGIGRGGVVPLRRLADDLAASQAAAGEGKRAELGIMIAAAALVDRRRAAEVAGDDE
jgi:hypothetical protein